ncbi:ESX secretion-associated protein EspG [Gandjariella thermophila]|uniref:ESX secretion-associated protein EspG n=1 Tax=Gandjariella thermophila TaxID=1931992 RepID=A0A4D4J8M7_9PSEU|nr:ESX secretion-associated protein EspG [Gandjariella thermophila]GDY31370.1 ESX secretion-associated protein EspG [Gandjariella thermophila]
MTPGSISLPVAAVDILWEQLRLGGPVFPFEIPHHGRTYEERARIRAAVLADLESRRLAHRGRVEPEVEDALTLLARSRSAVSAIALLDTTSERKLLARAGATGERAVLAVLDERALRLDRLRAVDLVAAVVGLLPKVPAGAGHSVTISPAVDMPRPAHENLMRGGAPRRASHAAQLGVAQEIMRRPRLRVGQFAAYAMDRNGHVLRSPELAWFDVESGRYVILSTRARDGHDWVTIAPAGSRQIARQLGEMLAAVSPK